MGTIDVVDGPANRAWADCRRGTRLTVPRRPLFSTDDELFVIGSCFAVDVRRHLRALGHRVAPDWAALDFDPARVRVGRLPERDNINHYDAATVQAEYERALGGAPAPAAEQFWRLEDPGVIAGTGLTGPVAYQNPFRKRLFADSLHGLVEISRRLDDHLAAAIRRATVHIVTVGQVEVWLDAATGAPLCRAPHPARRHEARFVVEDAATTTARLRRICELVLAHRPGTPIVVVVGPVALGRTFTDDDVVVANARSKAVLRAAAAAVESEFDEVTYWPAWELSLAEDLLAEDGRHLTPAAVRRIIDALVAAHGDR